MVKAIHVAAISATYVLIAFCFLGSYKDGLLSESLTSNQYVSTSCSQLNTRKFVRPRHQPFPTFSDLKKIQRLAESFLRQVRRRVVQGH